MAGGFFTVGHSNRSLAEFVEILRPAGVQLLADVRSFPRSRTNPAFNIDTLPDDLADDQVGYRHFPDLGGRRKTQPGIPDSVNALWRNRSFHNYADYALCDQFDRAFSELLELGRSHLTAIMCSEAVWWRCHRRILTDYLVLNGHPVVHLMGHGRGGPAKPTPGAERRADGKVVYPVHSATEPDQADHTKPSSPALSS